MRARAQVVGIVAVVALAIAGCNRIRKQDMGQIAEDLAAAGFQVKVAHTPEQLTQLRAMPQGKIRSTYRNGNRYYVFVDSESCHCFYLGDQNAYDEYRSARAEDGEERNAQDDANESMDENAAPDWGLWGIDSL